MMPPATDPNGLIHALGLSLVHFLWQGAAIAVVLRLVLAFCRAPRARYGWSLAAMAAMAAAPAATFWALASGSAEPGAAAMIVPAAPAFGPAWTWIVVAAWVAGVSMLGLRALVGFALVQRLRRLATPLPKRWAERCRVLAGRVAAPLRVTFAQSQDIGGPVVAGLFRPVVLIPTAALTRMPVEQLEALILHELAHVRRLDAVANLFQTVIEILLFYHPATWWVSGSIRIEREHCCDDLAVAEIGDAALYVHALQSLAQLPPPSAMLAANGAPLVERVRRLLLAEPPSRKFDMRAFAASLVAVAVLTLGWSAHVEAQTGRKAATVEMAKRVRVGAAAVERSDADADAARLPDGGGARASVRAAPAIARPAYDDALSDYQAAVGTYDATLTRYRETIAPSSGGGGEEERGPLNRQLGDANRQLGAASRALGVASRRLGGQPGSSEPAAAGSRTVIATSMTVNSGHGGTTTVTTGPTFSISGSDANDLFLLDGQRSSRAVLSGIPPARIAAIEVVDAGSPRARSQGARPDQSVVNVVTKPPT
jgi:beta-lactamase regulating signal transducer with metallopeptidase domain